MYRSKEATGNLGKFLLVSAIIVFIFCSLARHAKPVRIPVRFSRLSFPLVSVQIEEKEYPMVFTLGSPFSLQLSDPLLEEYSKEEGGVVQYYHADGEMREKPSFVIPSIAIAGVDNHNVQATLLERSYLFYDENGAENAVVGEVRDPFPRTKGLLVDFEHDVMFIAGQREVSKLGFPFDSAVRVRYEIVRDNLVLAVATEYGVKRLLLTTMANASALGKDTPHSDAALKRKGEVEFLVSKTVKLGGVDFGEVNFYLIDLNSKELCIDGFLGMDFLLKHRFYLDKTTQSIFFVNKKCN